MADISAAAVMKLRKMSGQGMMDCKKALQENDGDVDQAMEALRKKGIATLAKRSERDTSNGRIVCKTSDDGKTTVLASLCCETDFVAKSEDFVAAADRLCDYGLACDAEAGSEAVTQTVLDGKAYGEIITETVSKTGEKTEVGDFAKFAVDGPGLVSTYVHFNGKIGAMLQLGVSDDNVAQSDSVKAIADDVAMHITAVKPLSLDKDGIDAETVEKERAIYAEQVRDKPANIVDKIVDGKMNKFFAENCLLQQPFVKDDSKTVEQAVADAGKQAGGEAMVTRFVRFEVGG
jgi:elongation factor Ts